MEVEQDLQTRYEIYQRLGEERLIACAKDVGHVMAKESWERIDVLLDYMRDIDGINSLIETPEPLDY